MAREKDMTRREECNASKPGMVHWYDPGQLVKTGIQVLASIIWGSRADARIILAGLREDQELFDYSDRRELWIDYVADLGDGWNSTYAVAYCLAQERLSVRRSDGQMIETRRGDLLIMGGDEVYPAASREEYERRLVAPYEAAFPWSAPPHPHLFALPGNHDWYDGLVSFTRLFCQKTPPRWIGGWQLPQTRSYFALKLPHGWWLLGVDIQLEADIDGPQLEYFQTVAQQMARGDRVILCTPKPDWIYGAKRAMNLDYFERKILAPRGARVVLRLTGDIHHYRRHEHETADGSKVHLIIAGGGGAFLHPTHGPNVDQIRYGPDKACFRVAAEFPDRKTSRRLTLRNLGFPFLNPWFGFLPGITYMLLNWIMPHRLFDFDVTPKNVYPVVANALGELLRKPSAITWLLLITAVFMLFTRPNGAIGEQPIYLGLRGTIRRVWRKVCHFIWAWRIAGIVHAFAHLLVALFIAWLANRASVWLGGSPDSLLRFATTAGLTFAGGWLAGSLVMGFYLFISLTVFGQHANEAFSSLRIQDYKNFLRLHVDREGQLTVYPIGITKVPREWVCDHRASGSRYIPRDREIAPHLIEDPIVILPRPSCSS